MGGCATKPKELETEKGTAPVEQPPPITEEATDNTAAEAQAPTNEKDETERAVDVSNDEKDDGDEKDANLLPEASEPAPEPAKVEQVTASEAKPSSEPDVPVENKEIVAEEAKVEAAPAESKPEEAKVEAVPEEIKPEEAKVEAVKEDNELPKEKKEGGEEIAQIGESVVAPKIEEKSIQE